ncbi:hypothetical protein K438DRAFT_1781657 [Mycena galopus ATCC 62051]|nr:hypothetical protein K438DRAFT_1781657 [Mycena galopus ATCC 62051]
MREVERDQFWFREDREIVLEVQAWGSLPQDMREEIKLEVYPAKTGIRRTSDGTKIEGERQKDNGYLSANKRSTGAGQSMFQNLLRNRRRVPGNTAGNFKQSATP